MDAQIGVDEAIDLVSYGVTALCKTCAADTPYFLSTPGRYYSQRGIAFERRSLPYRNAGVEGSQSIRAQ